MRQINFLNFKESYYLHKQFVVVFLIVLFSIFSFLYGNNTYAEQEEIDLSERLEEIKAKKALVLELAKRYKEMEEKENSARLLEEAHIEEALELARRYEEKHKEIVFILENAGASERVLELARKRHTHSMETVLIIESNNPVQEGSDVARFMNQYTRDMAVELIYQRADTIRSLTALELAKRYAEEDRQFVSMLKNEAANMVQQGTNVSLALYQYEISMKIVSIIEEKTTITI